MYTGARPCLNHQHSVRAILPANHSHNDCALPALPAPQRLRTDRVMAYWWMLLPFALQALLTAVFYGLTIAW
jgi:hypothetical protein